MKVEAGGQAVPCGGDVVVLTAIRRREAMGLGQVQTQVVALYASGSTLSGCHHLVSSILVRRMIQKCPYIMHKERVQQLCNLLLIGKI